MMGILSGWLQETLGLSDKQMEGLSDSLAGLSAKNGDWAGAMAANRINRSNAQMLKLEAESKKKADEVSREMGAIKRGALQSSPFYDAQNLTNLPGQMQTGRTVVGDPQQAVYNALIKAGYIDEATKYRPKVAHTVETMRDGAPVSLQLDEYGQPVGQSMQQWKAPVQINTGGAIQYRSPVGLDGQNFQITMDPAQRDASARGWAGVNIQKQAAERANRAEDRVAKSLGDAKWDSARGQFVYDPSEQYPQGRAVSPDGVVTTHKGSAAAVNNGQKDATDALALIAQAKKLIPKSTSSYIGAGLDAAGRMVGYGTSGADTGAQLKAIGGMLTAKMPKMSGPQSDKDVQLYREMAGQVGDTTLPVSTRMAALNAVEEIQQRYANDPTGIGRPQPSQTQPTRVIGKTYNTDGVDYVYLGGDIRSSSSYRKK